MAAYTVAAILENDPSVFPKCFQKLTHRKVEKIWEKNMNFPNTYLPVYLVRCFGA